MNVEREREREREMDRWKRWWCFKNKFLFQTKRLALSITSRLAYKHKGNLEHGLVKLYEDKESCREYEDIQVMWEMIHSSFQPTSLKTQSKKRSCYLRLCFIQQHDDTWEEEGS
ncbi:hypothetical protein NE237_009501 [Protea cynaroides]|uniref:Uncharacterized protein n=1 Tax=Protea cynaroides TaxID=273540 RepID=A0A9Q0KYG5_9MAGN|nr:hypothetical protein NE237_009501 [Protea cynaroides]